MTENIIGLLYQLLSFNFRLSDINAALEFHNRKISRFVYEEEKHNYYLKKLE